MTTDNITVAIKVRPIIQREINEGLRTQWKIQDTSIRQIDHNGQVYGEPYKFGEFKLQF